MIRRQRKARRWNLIFIAVVSVAILALVLVRARHPACA
jgi:hypothetical protein